MEGVPSIIIGDKLVRWWWEREGPDTHFLYFVDPAELINWSTPLIVATALNVVLVVAVVVVQMVVVV